MSKCNKKVAVVTGSIGSGKSTVAIMFGELGVSIVSADTIARRISAPGESAYSKIINLFGQSILDSHGAIDRRLLGRIIFENASLKASLEDILLPVIREVAGSECEKAIHGGQEFVIYEAPIFFEANLNSKDFLAVICVVASREQCIARASARLDISHEDVIKRLNLQKSFNEKISLSDFVIDNSGSLDSTKEQVARLYDVLMARVS